VREYHELHELETRRYTAGRMEACPFG